MQFFLRFLRLVCTGLFLTDFQLDCHSQSAPAWTAEYCDGTAALHQFFQVETVFDNPYILCYTTDSNCVSPHVSVIQFTSNGIYNNEVYYGNVDCQPVNPVDIFEFQDKLYMAVDDSAQTLNALGIVACYDANLTLLNRARTNETTEHPSVGEQNHDICVFSNDALISVYNFDTSGIENWHIDEANLFGVTSGYRRTSIEGDTVFVMCAGRKDQVQTTREIIVTVLDNLGNRVDTISYDPYPSVSEQVFNIEHSNGNFVFAAGPNSTSGSCKVGAFDRGGGLLWQQNIPELVRYLAIDSASNSVMLFTTFNQFSTVWHFYRLNQLTGVILDTMAIDSVYGGYSRVSFLHENGLGVYMADSHTGFGHDYRIERYNVFGLVDWSGVLTTTGTNAYDLEEMSLSSDGSLYLIGTALNDTNLICKFTPAPLEAEELFPSEASTIFPNPVIGNGELTVSGIDEEFAVAIYSCSGALVQKNNNVFPNTGFHIEVTAPGIYFVEILTISGSRSMSKIAIH